MTFKDANIDSLKDSFVTDESRFFENKNRIAPRVLPTRLAAKYISKTPNALRIMKCRGLITEAGVIGNEKYYAISDLERLLRKRR